MRGNGFSLAVRWKSGGGSPTIRWQSAIESIPAWHERLKNVVLLKRDAFEVIPRISDDAETVIYCDPPYFAESRSGYRGSGAHSRYEHEFDNCRGGLFGDDHDRLADALNHFKNTRVIVSYYDCDRARDLYRDWTFVECGSRKNITNQNGITDREAPEVLIINGPSLSEINHE